MQDSGINFTGVASENARYQKAILDWIDKDIKEQKVLKARNDTLYVKYDKAKEKLGLLRGRQKNYIKSYKEVTETFKTLALEYGRHFAELREKLREESELNKLSHLGVIIEDSHQDRYVLMVPLEAERGLGLTGFLQDKREGEFKACLVKSLTSKTLEKLIKNRGAYKDFHVAGATVDFDQIKRDWANYKNNPDFLIYVKNCLQNSGIAKSQNWKEFGCDFSRCNTYEEIEHELDAKAYIFEQWHLSGATITGMINHENCLLLPFVNQDITSKERLLKNRFSKDWSLLFDKVSNYRLHPQFKIVYRQPTPDYPANKRYSRFQMIAQLLCEYVPKSSAYLSRKEQIRLFNDKEEQVKAVDAFNMKIKPKTEFYIFGIDRGLRQLATLCVLNRDGQIQGDFDIYTRAFDADKKQWLHTKQDTRAILDLSNLRVETTVTGDRVLVDLASIGIKVRDKSGKETGETKENQQKIKLKQLAYIRKLQYQMQNNEENIIRFLEQNATPESVEKNIGDLITPYKEGTKFTDLPTEKIFDMLMQYKEYAGKTDDLSTKAKKELSELDAAEDLKSGVVANMVGVVAYLLKEYNYNVFISLENLCRAYRFATDGLTGDVLPSTAADKEMNFKDQENMVLAGLGTYQFFEMQLLKKLFRIQKEKEKNICHLVPAFRSVDNYERIIRKKEHYTYYPFGIVHFVDPRNTSQKCPVCEKTHVKRESSKGDTVMCKDCGFQTTKDIFNAKNNEIIDQHKKRNMRLEYIRNGDDNGAYHIALKTLKNLKEKS